jgi:hypothetical protein
VASLPPSGAPHPSAPASFVPQIEREDSMRVTESLSSESVPSSSLQEQSYVSQFTPPEFLSSSSRSISDVNNSRSLSSDVSQSSIPLELIKKAPVLGLLDTDYILNKGHDLTIVPQKQPKGPPPKVPFGFKNTNTRKELMDQMAMQCLEHRAKV